MSYHTVTNEVAMYNFLVLNAISFSDKPDYFIESTDDSKNLRCRCLFKKDESVLGGVVVLFHPNTVETELITRSMASDNPVYLYGTKGQMNVLQVKASGKIRKMTDSEISEFIDSLRSGFDWGTVSHSHTDPKKLIENVQINLNGPFYAFETESYEQSCYERG